jgi:hypothetical protein
MHTTAPFLLLAAITPFALGCDRGEAQSIAIGGGASALVGDEASADTEVTADAGTTSAESVEATPVDTSAALTTADSVAVDEFVPEPLAVTWTDGADDGAATALSFDVTNTSDVEIAFSIAVVALSAIGDARVAMGEATLASGEVEAYSLSATDLPVRSDKVVSQLFVQLTRGVVTPEGSQDVTALEAGRFYRHDATLGTVRTFTERALLDDLGGVTSRLPLGSEKDLTVAANAAIGDVADGDGGFAAVTAAESGAILRNDSGRIVGYRLETSRSAAPGAVAATTEVEVTDE